MESSGGLPRWKKYLCLELGHKQGYIPQESCMGEVLMLACLGGRLRSAETNMSNGLFTTGATGGGGESCGSGSGNVECTLRSSDNTGFILNRGAINRADWKPQRTSLD